MVAAVIDQTTSLQVMANSYFNILFWKKLKYIPVNVEFKKKQLNS